MLLDFNFTQFRIQKESVFIIFLITHRLFIKKNRSINFVSYLRPKLLNKMLKLLQYFPRKNYNNVNCFVCNFVYIRNRTCVIYSFLPNEKIILITGKTITKSIEIVS